MTTNVPTFDRATYLRARDAWDRGRFGSEWSDWRGMAGKRGILFPPDGSPEDSWSDAHPSQRAIVYRAIVETPRLLRWAIHRPGVTSWGDVIGHLLSGRDAMGLEADIRAGDWDRIKRGADPTRIADILGTISDSMGVER